MMQHLSPIEIKAMIKREMNWSFKVAFSTTERQLSPMSQSTRTSDEQERKGAKAINEERKRSSSASDAIKTVTLNHPTINPIVVLKTGYRQTDRHTHTQTDRQTHTHTHRQTDTHTHRQTDRQTKYLLTVWQTLQVTFIGFRFTRP